MQASTLRKKPWTKIIDKRGLVKLYIVDDLSMKKIASKLGTYPDVIHAAIHDYGITPKPTARPGQGAGASGSNWRGKNVTYKGAHIRVNKQRGSPKKCEMCGTSRSGIRYQWASLSKEYHDPNDYIRLCTQCHRDVDGPSCQGVDSPKSKLSEDDVRSIRKLYGSGKHTQKEIGDMFGVTQTCVGGILRGRSWKHLV